jgi:adenosylmethionine-8-amino-7-oxononanoate aminotransferase
MHSNLKEKDKRYVWHPYTQMRDYINMLDAPVIVKGEGPYLIDEDGVRYLDGVASMWCNVWGHTRQEIVNAIIDQVKELQHSTLFGLTNDKAVILAEMLVSLAKGMGKVFYSDNGSTAVEVALKMALQYWYNKGYSSKSMFISLENAYHGDTVGAMSIGYLEHFFKPYESMLFKVKKVPTPYMYRKHLSMSDYDYMQYCLDMLEKELKEHSNDGKGNRIAGVVMESGAQIAGGGIVYPKGYQKAVRELCNKYDTLFILDEVATGFGRLGSMIEYVEQESIPDIVAFGKMLTAGYLPLAVTLSTDDVYNAFLGEYDEHKHLFHGHTFTGNPIACACAIANIELYKREDLIARVRSNARIIEDRLDEFMSYSIVGDVRHKGMLLAVELVKDRASKVPLRLKHRRVNYAIMQEALKRRVFLRPLGHIMLIIPPLALSKDTLNTLLDNALDIIDTLQRDVV